MGALLLMALLLGYFYELQPCLLCVLARVMVLLIAALCLGQLLCTKASLKYWMMEGLGCSLLVIGISMNGYHIWLQHRPNPAEGCLPPLSHFLEQGAWGQAVQSFFVGQSCSVIDWQWLGWSLPEWLMGAYLVVLVLYMLNIIGGIYAEEA